MKISAFIFAVMFAANCCAQVVAAPRLAASDLRSDAAILRKAYEQLHPGLYRYNSKAQMDADFDELDRELSHDRSLQEAFLAFSEFAAKVRCGHTQANPFNQPKAVIEALFKSPTRLPFYFDWLNGHMIVTRDFTPGKSLPPGTDVLTINGVSARAVLARLLTIARADGANDSKRVAQLAVNGDSKYEIFDLYYPLFFPAKTASDTLVVRRPKSSGSVQVSVKPLTYEERVAPIREREEQRSGGDQPLFTWKYMPDGSGYLKMQTWALYNTKWDWKQWLDSHMDDAVARSVPALIIDLRGNEGGNDIGNEIIPYLIDSPLTLSSMRRLVRYRKVPDDLVPYLDTWDKGFRDWGASAVDLKQPWPTAPEGVNYLALTRFDDGDAGDILKPAAKRFRGKVFVLVDATNSSATFQFAQTVQQHHLGTLVGQTTGGSQRGINGGAFFFLRLPRSGIEMDVPLIGTFPSLPQPDAGITPDIPVTISAPDIASGRDPALLAVSRALHR